MIMVWIGDLVFEDAVRTGALRLAGRRELVRCFPAGSA